MHKILLLSLTVLALATPGALAQTPEECLARVRTMKPKIPGMMDGCKTLIKNLIPDPVAYEKSLPPFSQVLSGKDTLNFKNYGGLAEAYYYKGDKTKGESLYKPFAAHATELLGASDNFAAGVTGDIGLLYFSADDYAHAEPFLLSAIKQIEKNTTPAIANNLIADYMCIALIRDKQGKIAEASQYSKKLVETATKLRDNKL